MKSRFIIRVYGLALVQNKVLVTDERYQDYTMTKFPGGGMEFGEGPIETLKREFKEEFNWNVKVIGHAYTTDFFVPSAFDPTQQIISLYYWIELDPNASDVPTSSEADYPAPGSSNPVSARWCAIDQLNLSFPIDIYVGKKLASGDLHFPS